MVLIPILVLLPEGAKNRAEIIRAGADVVLETPYDLKEVELQAYALIRRYIDVYKRQFLLPVVQVVSGGSAAAR